jgi:FkbM family methyltransferase
MENSYLGWRVLDGDRTLRRAFKKSNITNILDYQKDQLDTAMKYCKNFRHAIDVGANYGIMSANMSKDFEKISAFEIVPEINHCLKENVKNFNLHNVEIYDCGLGEKEEKVFINFNPKSTFSTHVSTSQESTNKVNISTLDSYNFVDVDFIKIDAEGFENFIIKGGMKTIIKYNPIILYERKTNSKRYGLEKNSVLDMLASYGYIELENIGSKNALIGVK